MDELKIMGFFSSAKVVLVQSLQTARHRKKFELEGSPDKEGCGNRTEDFSVPPCSPLRHYHTMHKFLVN